MSGVAGSTRRTSWSCFEGAALHMCIKYLYHLKSNGDHSRDPMIQQLKIFAPNLVIKESGCGSSSAVDPMPPPEGPFRRLDGKRCPDLKSKHS